MAAPMHGDTARKNAVNRVQENAKVHAEEVTRAYKDSCAHTQIIARMHKQQIAMPFRACVGWGKRGIEFLRIQTVHSIIYDIPLVKLSGDLGRRNGAVPSRYRRETR